MSLFRYNWFDGLKEVFRSDSLRHHIGLLGFISLPISLGLWIISYKIFQKDVENKSEEEKVTQKADRSKGDVVTFKGVHVPTSPSPTQEIEICPSGEISRASSILLLPTRQQFPNCSELTPVIVSSVKDCTHMCVQLAEPHFRNALDSLVEDLTRFYNNKTGEGKHAPRHVNRGDYVAALLPEDQTWQRAEVHDFQLHFSPSKFSAGFHGSPDPDRSTVEVDYCDYGDSSRLRLRHIRLLTDAGSHMAEQFLQLPFQAIPLQLAGIKSKRPDGEWDEEAVEYFEEISCNELLAKRLVNLPACTDDGGVLAQLIDPNAPKPRENNLAAELVRMGYAEWIDY